MNMAFLWTVDFVGMMSSRMQRVVTLPNPEFERFEYRLDFLWTLRHLLAQSSCSKFVDYLLQVFHFLH